MNYERVNQAACACSCSANIFKQKYKNEGICRTLNGFLVRKEGERERESSEREFGESSEREFGEREFGEREFGESSERVRRENSEREFGEKESSEREREREREAEGGRKRGRDNKENGLYLRWFLRGKKSFFEMRDKDDFSSSVVSSIMFKGKESLLFSFSENISYPPSGP